MTKDNPAQTPQVSLSDIRGVYAHLPNETPQASVMSHPAILVFAHDPENAANAAGQTFLSRNNDPATRARQPLAVAAEMIAADYKIFDLTPPERQIRPAHENDVGLAVSYGMVTVEQGVDFIALSAIGQDTEKLLPRLNTLGDVIEHGAMNVAACYGALIAASMAGVSIVAPQALADCLGRIALSENTSMNAASLSDGLQDFALELIRRKALAQIV